MKKNCFLILLLVMSGSVANAYDWDPSIYRVGEKYPGYVITNEKDTLYGYIKALQRCNFTAVSKSNQNYCEFYKNENDKKPIGKYKPNDLYGYLIADKFYKSIAYSGGLSKSKNFCLQMSEGRISTYRWFTMQENGNTMIKNDMESWEEYDQRRFTSHNVIQKADEQPREESYYLMSFAKRVSELVEEHKDLSESIKEKEEGYRMLKFYDIIEEYNLWYLENH